MDRRELDHLTAAWKLSPAGAMDALQLTGARPSRDQWRAFAAHLAQVAGVVSLIAGAIFFVAANWQAFGVTGRFVLLQSAFAIAIGLAIWRAPPARSGHMALVVAMMLVGAMFALFGQTYQTGADVYELFLIWALFALPFAIVAQNGVHWALWWCILNVALALFTGFLGTRHFLWMWFDRFGFDRAPLLMAAAIINFAGAAVFARLGTSRFAVHAPEWLIRLLLTFGFGYGTVASMIAIAGTQYGARQGGRFDAAVLLTFAAISAALAFHTMRVKRDVFPLALIAAAWIAISSTFLVRHLFGNRGDAGAFFVIALWLIGTSTAASFFLMARIRQWRGAAKSLGAAS
jgi:uncharacterized membrane protein